MAMTFTRSGKTLAAALFGAVATGALILAPKYLSAADASPIEIEAPEGAPVSFAELIDKVSPAVVSVNVVSEREVGDLADMERFFEQFRGMPGFEDFMDRRFGEDNEDEAPRTEEARSLGSGFFITEDGFIVTNHHVVRKAKEIMVVLEDGRELRAEVVGSDPQTDLAVIKVQEEGDYPYVEFSEDPDLRRGDWVVALGNPFGLGGTATAGIVSAMDRRDALGRSSTYTDFLQIDAAINRGNSGGPTFNLQGDVVGVNTAIFSPNGGSVGIGFAIPSGLAEEITDTLIEDGRVSRGWLGVSIQDLTEDMAEAQGLDTKGGAIVAEVNADSPADEADLRRGDVILAVNGKAVEDATDLTREVGKLIAGSKNTFRILRGDKRMTVNVTVGERPEDPYAGGAGASPGDGSGASDGDRAGPFGARYAPLDEEAREALGLDGQEEGVLVADLPRSSVLHDAGLREGMAILEVNGTAVKSGRALADAVETARKRGRSNVLMAVRNGEATIFITVDIAEEG